ncbi:MAG: hypothetical protein GEV13_13730 [Rhodospirillales bacterium]|nr:hypothetical protein [Rhodospirillales bacterium]
MPDPGKITVNIVHADTRPGVSLTVSAVDLNDSEGRPMGPYPLANEGDARAVDVYGPPGLIEWFADANGLPQGHGFGENVASGGPVPVKAGEVKPEEKDK